MYRANTKILGQATIEEKYKDHARHITAEEAGLWLLDTNSFSSSACGKDVLDLRTYTRMIKTKGREASLTCYPDTAGWGSLSKGGG